MSVIHYSDTQLQQARLSRDPRFDGLFFIAVKTTGIFCRPICPATPPKENNVVYFQHAAQAAQAGYRPCLRCRPDSAPGSWAWQGVSTTFQRALQLIEQGALQQQTLPELAERLGITDRYLRQLFDQHLGMSPKQFAQFHQLMFAKQLLASSQLSIADIGLAAGFNSVRRFNDAFQKILKLTPSDVRKTESQGQPNEIRLAYRPPFNWQHTLDFLRRRLIDGIEWIDGQAYGRSFQLGDAHGWFQVSPGKHNTLSLRFEIDQVSALRLLVNEVRRVFDLDADVNQIEAHLANTPLKPLLTNGLRIPGIWSSWEAGVRAVLGQQVSVKAAINQVNLLAQTLGETRLVNGQPLRFFPSPQQVADADVSFLRMPTSRKETLSRLAQFIASNPQAHPTDWLSLKGIGPWTTQYAMLRGLSEPDQFLATDLIVKKALNTLPDFNLDDVSPWGSYATFHCWNSHS